MKIFFLHLHYHEKSKSSKWFIEILEKNNQVIPIAIDIDYTMCFEVVGANPDIVICWQTEQLVPWFISRNIAAIAIPMADGCENMPQLYYQRVGQLGSISLSKFIYERFLCAKVPSLFISYYPKSDDKLLARKIHTKRDIDIFYPYRSKKWTIVNNISEYLSRNFDIHIHENIDNYYEYNFKKFNSYYFNDISELDNILLRSDFFLCPRYTEGIGVSTLRAMNLGCIPIGLDGPGNCEYFSEDNLGIVIPFKAFNENHTKLQTEIAKRKKNIVNYREKIFKKIMAGRVEFEKSTPNILSYIENRVFFFKENKREFIKKNSIYKIIKPTTFIWGSRIYKLRSLLSGKLK